MEYYSWDVFCLLSKIAGLWASKIIQGYSLTEAKAPVRYWCAGVGIAAAFMWGKINPKSFGFSWLFLWRYIIILVSRRCEIYLFRFYDQIQISPIIHLHDIAWSNHSLMPLIKCHFAVSQMLRSVTVGIPPSTTNIPETRSCGEDLGPCLVHLNSRRTDIESYTTLGKQDWWLSQLWQRAARCFTAIFVAKVLMILL